MRREKLSSMSERGTYVPADPMLRTFARRLRSLSERTIEEYVREIEILGAFLDGRLTGVDPFGRKARQRADRSWANAPFERLGSAGFSDLVEYVDWLQDRKLSMSGLRRKLAAVRAYYGFLRTYGYREDNPTNELPMPKVPKRDVKIVPTEGIRAIRHARPQKGSTYAAIRNAAIISFLYSAGVRRAELVALNLADVDIEQRRAHVFGKGKKKRWVVFDKETAALLATYRSMRGRGEDNAFFLGREVGKGLRRRISYDYVRDVVAQFAARVGLEGITPHMLRHSIATHLLEEGMDLQQIADQLGHENVATTSIYLHAAVKRRQTKYDEIMEQS
jgi:site-specific recombinase XerD